MTFSIQFSEIRTPGRNYGCPSTESACVLDQSFDLSRDLDHAPSLPRAERGQASGQAVQGCINNYSIIFTEISFSPETSILLQIIRKIHMTFQVIPEYDR